METAQTALQTFLTKRLKLDWEILTAAQKTAHVVAKEGLQIAVEKELEANRIETDATNLQETVTRKEQLITLLKSRGYACDNSLSDWIKLFNRPDIFGDNWQNKAMFHFQQSTGLDDFIKKIISIIL